MLKDYFVDLHVHIGRTRKGAAVKISAAPSLTLQQIMNEAPVKKGMDIIGVIDCHVDEVLAEIEEAVENGKAVELEGGGVKYPDATLYLGTEIELNDEEGQGPIHVLLFLPTIEKMRECSEWLKDKMTNPTLSSQRVYETARNIQKKVKQFDGLFIPAHVFTPFKSLYGKGVKRSLQELLDPDLIDAIELGLSSDSEMADHIAELHRYPYLSNSDAHSLEKIGREYQMIKMASTSFAEFRLALMGKNGRQIVSNYGLNPRLGKYYETICAKCNQKVEEHCEHCQSPKQIKGVAARIMELETANGITVERPPYVHQIPLEFIPKVGKKTLEKLRKQFGSDMEIIHYAEDEKIKKIVPQSVYEVIIAARNREISVQSGGGGIYGKITKS